MKEETIVKAETEKISRPFRDWLLDRFMKMVDKEAAIGYRLSRFAHENKDLLIIAGDPKTDALFIAYNDNMRLRKIKTADGKVNNIVKKVLAHSTFKNTIDFFITGIMEALQLKLKDGNLFYQFIDSGLYWLSQSFKHDIHKTEADENAIITQKELKGR